MFGKRLTTILADVLQAVSIDPANQLATAARNMNQSQPIASTAFPHFHLFPDKVRRLIWTLATQKRIVEVKLPESGICVRHEFISDIPVIMLVNKDSRAVGLTIYIQLYNNNSLNCAWLHPVHDILLIRGGHYITQHIGLLSAVLPNKELIEKLGVVGKAEDFTRITGFFSLRKIVVIERAGAFFHHGVDFCGGFCTHGFARATILPNNKVLLCNEKGEQYWRNECRESGPSDNLMYHSELFSQGSGIDVRFFWKRACRFITIY